MDETLIGTVPNKPMTNLQRRVHHNLARAEKNLIAVIITEQPDPRAVEAAERRCARWTTAWKRACARG